jgi:hypothetical protein
MVMFSYVFHQQLLSYGFFNHSSSSIFTLGGLNPSQKYVRKFQPIIKIYMVEQLYIYRNHPPQKKNTQEPIMTLFLHILTLQLVLARKHKKRFFPQNTAS